MHRTSAPFQKRQKLPVSPTSRAIASDDSDLERLASLLTHEAYHFGRSPVRFAPADRHRERAA
jgi:hypothetical protein